MMMRSGTDRKVWYLIPCLMIFLFLMSWLPYKVPVAPVNSDSYMFGYNNRVGEIIVSIAALLLFFWGPRLRSRFPPGQALQRSTLLKAFAVTALISVLLLIVTWRLDGFTEGIYLIDRVKLALAGERPYRQFEYIYGPLFLYGPVFICRLLHISGGRGYVLFWLGVSLLGPYLLYKTILWVDIPTAAKRPIFLLFWSFSVFALFCFGVNYSLVRFVLPCYFSLIVYRALRSHGHSRQGAWVLLLPVPMYAVLLLISPELGIAFAAGIAVYFLRFGRIRVPANLAAFLGMLGGMAGLTWIVAKLGIFVTMAAFGKGGYNFPIMPAPNVLVLYLFVGLAACYAGEHFRTGRQSALIMLICISAVSLAGALGRCDLAHTLLDPFGISIAGMFLISGSPILRRYIQPTIWFIFVVLVFAQSAKPLMVTLRDAAIHSLLRDEPPGTITRTDRIVLAATTKLLGKDAAEEKFARAKIFGRLNETIDFDAMFGVPKHTIFEAPFGFRPGESGTYYSPSIGEGYYLGTQDLITPDAVARKVAEMSSHPDRPLLLQPGDENGCIPRSDQELWFISHLFVYPYRATAVHVPDVLEPICAYIRNNYHLAEPAVPTHFEYQMWLRN